MSAAATCCGSPGPHCSKRWTNGYAGSRSSSSASTGPRQPGSSSCDRSGSRRARDTRSRSGPGDLGASPTHLLDDDWGRRSDTPRVSPVTRRDAGGLRTTSTGRCDVRSPRSADSLHGYVCNSGGGSGSERHRGCERSRDSRPRAVRARGVVVTNHHDPVTCLELSIF